MRKEEFSQMFPSPMGIFFVSITTRGDKKLVQHFVSVPYGDLFYFYKAKELYNEDTPLVFPSPMGIFFISIIANGYFEFPNGRVFPSPMGIFFISILI